MSRLAERGPPSSPERSRDETAPTPAARDASPIRRHPGDVVRVVVGGVILAVSAAIAAAERVSTFERDLLRLVNHLPSVLEIPIIGVVQAGAVGAVPVRAAVALAARRPRLARDLAVSGTAAWVLAKVVKEIVSRAGPDALLSGVILRHATPRPRVSVGPRRGGRCPGDGGRAVPAPPCPPRRLAGGRAGVRRACLRRLPSASPLWPSP